MTEESKATKPVSSLCWTLVAVFRRKDQK